jgi:hypothetical protein
MEVTVTSVNRSDCHYPIMGRFYAKKYLIGDSHLYSTTLIKLPYN